jgi:hypothetical protein
MALETDIPVGGAQQKIEKMLTAPLQLPREGGPFILDQSVIDVHMSRGHSIMVSTRRKG